MSDKTLTMKEVTPEVSTEHTSAQSLSVNNQGDGKFLSSANPSPATEALPPFQIYDSANAHKPSGPDVVAAAPETPEQKIVDQAERYISHEQQVSKFAKEYSETPWLFHEQTDIHGKEEIVRNKYQPI